MEYEEANKRINERGMKNESVWKIKFSLKLNAFSHVTSE
jgi:hypothetical protein